MNLVVRTLLFDFHQPFIERHHQKHLQYSISSQIKPTGTRPYLHQPSPSLKVIAEQSNIIFHVQIHFTIPQGSQKGISPRYGTKTGRSIPVQTEYHQQSPGRDLFDSSPVTFQPAIHIFGATKTTAAELHCFPDHSNQSLVIRWLRACHSDKIPHPPHM